MKYIITQSQFHSLVYNYLNSLFKDEDIKQFNVFDSGNSYTIHFDHNHENIIKFYFFAEGESFDNDESEESTRIQVHYELVDRLVKLFGIRQSRVLDIIADWVSEKLNTYVDEIVIYPKKRDF